MAGVVKITLVAQKISAVAPPDFEESRERGRIADHLID
jgi:hypothetical protein